MRSLRGFRGRPPGRACSAARPAIWLVLAALVAGGQFAHPARVAAQAAGEADIELRVQQLVQRLGSDNGNVRDAAERQLLELGANILPLLPTATASLPPVATEPLTRLRDALLAKMAEEVGRASQLSLRGRLSLASLLEEVYRQTGNRVVDQRRQLGGDAPELEIPVDAMRREFWPAMDDILDEGGLAWYATSGVPRALALQAARPGEASRAGEACYRGAFRLAVTQVAARRSTRLPDDAGLLVRLELLWEPKLAPLLIRQRLVDLAAEDDTGRLLAARDSSGASEVPVASTVSGTELTLHLPLPSREARQLARLKGRLSVVTPGPEETFEFDRLELAAAPRSQKRPSGVVVTLEEVRRAGDTVTCLVKLQLPSSSPPLESHLDWARRNVAYLVAPDGRRIDDPVVDRYREGEREVGHAYLFPLAGDTPGNNAEDLAGYRLVYRTPGTLVEVPVEYEFTGIALP